LSQVDTILEARADLLVERLRRLVAQPTISATDDGMLAGAELVAALARECGVRAKTIDGPGHPCVLSKIVQGASAKTLLVTTHFDVQPVGPLDHWQTPPFELTERPDGLLLGRGSTDAKGAVVGILAAIEALIEVHGHLPCNVAVLFDGEEEIGSPSMGQTVDAHVARLRPDAVVSFDGNSDPGDRPAIYLGSGGLLYVELRVRTGSRDLHANRGALVPNAGWRMIWALASLKDAQEQILIDGFAAQLAPTSEAERLMLAELPDDGLSEREGSGVGRLLPGRGGDRVAVAEALHLLPIVGLSGVSSGYTGEGAMTIIPAEARAKLYFGLREGQQPDTVLTLLRRHLDAHGFEDVEIEVLGETEPASCALDSAVSLAAIRACERASGLNPAVYPRSHAYGRQGCWIARRLGIQAAHIAGVGPYGARNHSANEFNTRACLVRGARLMAAVIEEFATSPPSR
jgi:acetylornithine deacetylase/succinyl-diaminopimelate desuccinylase-like protein